MGSETSDEKILRKFRRLTFAVFFSTFFVFVMLSLNFIDGRQSEAVYGIRMFVSIFVGLGLGWRIGR